MAKYKTIKEICKDKRCPYKHNTVRKFFEHRFENGLQERLDIKCTRPIMVRADLFFEWLEMRRDEIAVGIKHTQSTPLICDKKPLRKKLFFEKMINKIIDVFTL